MCRKTDKRNTHTLTHILSPSRTVCLKRKLCLTSRSNIPKQNQADQKQNKWLNAMFIRSYKPLFSFASKVLRDTSWTGCVKHTTTPPLLISVEHERSVQCSPHWCGRETRSKRPGQPVTPAQCDLWCCFLQWLVPQLAVDKIQASSSANTF